MDASSPISKFIKPTDSFKLKRSLSSLSSVLSPSKIPFSPLKCLQNNELHPNDLSPLRFRKTPKKIRIRNSLSSKKSPEKKARTGKRKLNFQSNVKSNKNNGTEPLVNVDCNENANLGFIFSPKKSELTHLLKENGSEQDCDILIDWSLKSKVIFTSQKPFPWKGNFRASEEATGISSFVRCIYNSPNKSDPRITDTLDTSWSAQLSQNTLVWMHPNLPWLTLFPRTQNSVPGQPVPFKPPPFLIIPNTPLADSLHSDWCASVKSLYQMVKAMQCPYFYLCANQFTALFRASGITGCDEIQILITPTTLGFRNLLSKENIDFSLPFQSENENDFNNINLNQSLPASFDHDDVDVINDGEDSNVWLESLGLSQQDFPSLQQKRKKLRTNSNMKKKSLVLIKGMSNCQLFINLIMNSRVCIPTSGPLSGVPPTLISPVAFQGATLKSLKLRQTKSDSFYSLELTGPILPNVVCGLLNLFKQTQNDFKASFSTYELSKSFAMSSLILDSQSTSCIAFATENLKDCGLKKELISSFCEKEHQSDDSISEVVCSSNNFTYF